MPDFDKVLAEEKAMAYALGFPGFTSALHFFVEWPNLPYAARLILSRPGEIDVAHLIRDVQYAIAELPLWHMPAQYRKHGPGRVRRASWTVGHGSHDTTTCPSRGMPRSRGSGAR